MEEHAKALADAVEAALPGWVERCVRQRLPAVSADAEATIMAAAAEAGQRAAADVGPKVRALLEQDIDEQPTTPLTLLRDGVRYPTAVLSAAGVPPVERDRMQVRLFPDDVYDLAPATFADVDPRLAELGLLWGAAKAYVHLQRHGGGRQ